MIMGFLETLRETQKMFLKNRNLIASITSVSLLLYSVLLLCNFFSIKPLITDLLAKQSLLFITSPSAAEFTDVLLAIRESLCTFAQVEYVFILAFSVISLFFSMATILASAITYAEKTLPFKDLLSITVKSCKRTFITLFYVHLFIVGYVTLAWLFLFPMLLTSKLRAVTLLLSILALIFYVYLDILWTLATVISVLEERHGIEALGKASQIVKGMEPHGFLLNLLFTVLSSTVFQGLGLISQKQSPVITIIIGLIVLNCICLIRMCWFIAYTVFYWKCKKIHGEEVELQGTTEYSSSATTPLIHEYLHDERKISIDVSES